VKSFLNVHATTEDRIDYEYVKDSFYEELERVCVCSIISLNIICKFC
jgi:hypothetical protein